MSALTLRQWRLVKEKTQEEMANALNVHVNTYISWEKNPGKISIDKAMQISEVLDVSIDDIIFSASTLQNVEEG